jgi:hypothetical protein
MESELDLSIIVEWENVLFSRDERCFRMLEQLRKQLGEVGRTAEVIVLYNPKQLDGTLVESALLTHFGVNAPAILRCEPVRKHYYGMKNEGAARARGEIVIFIDSDVVPEDGWLEALTRPFFDNSRVRVVAGHTYLSHETFIEKAFALGWFFPLRDGGDSLYAGNSHFYANNVAFRRATFLKFRFPKMPRGVRRGSCAQLAQRLTRHRIPIWTQTAARTHHPPPSGLRHYVIRAFAHGRDNVLGWKSAGLATGRMLHESLKWTRHRLKRMNERIREGRDQVGLPAWQAPLAYAVMLAFYGLALAGHIITIAFPRFASRHWKI